jgi:hypothetical protein
MKKQIFPKEILDNTYEVHQFKHSKRSKRIYACILLLILGMLSSLPFIKVDLYTSVRGIIKTQEERIPLRITQSGQVVYTQLAPHRTVAKGDTLLRLAHPVLDEKKNLLLGKLKEHLFLIQDLQHLTESPEPGIPHLQTSNYKKQWAFFLQGQVEATSSLDSQSEQYIQKTIQRLREDQKTIIIIAHRLSTVVHADEIVVLENGKVVESGTHKELIKEKGNYYSLWQQQTLNL